MVQGKTGMVIGDKSRAVIPGIPKSGCLVARSPSTVSLDFSWYHSDKNTDSNAIRPSGAAPRPSVARVAGPRNEGVMK